MSSIENDLIFYDDIYKKCREISTSKLEDYNVTWIEYRLMTVIDHILIKALRIKTLEENNDTSMVGEDRKSEYYGIINYSIIALTLFYYKNELPIQNKNIEKDTIDKIIYYYDKIFEECRELMIRKNHDYGSAWKVMEVTSFTDIIIARIYRIKSIIANNFDVNSENIDAQLMDMINYSIFALIKMDGLI